MKEFIFCLNGSAISQQRIKKGYTQEQLSELTDISKSQIQRIESNKPINCTINTYIHLMKALDPEINIQPFCKYLSSFLNL